MNSFEVELQKKVDNSLRNNYDKGNFDEYRFGKYPRIGKIQKFKSVVKKIIRYQSTPKFNVSSTKLIMEFGPQLYSLYEILNDNDKKLLVDLISFKLLGYQKVKLSLNNHFYWKALDKVKNLKNGADSINPNFIHYKLERFDLKPLGYDISIYLNDFGIAVDYIFEQYCYKMDDKVIVEAEPRDVVLDIGGCWGDTALYFASKVGRNGKVFSFEFIPNNIKIFEKNIGLNEELQSRIFLIKSPVSDVSGKQIYFIDNGPGSFVSDQQLDGTKQGETATISIDDFVVNNKISKVDFIKMDIEGAEQLALAGAFNTIKKFKPKLAIAIYHSMNDFVTIPKWIEQLQIDYELFLGHYTIHEEETILFAKPRR